MLGWNGISSHFLMYIDIKETTVSTNLIARRVLIKFVMDTDFEAPNHVEDGIYFFYQQSDTLDVSKN